MRKSEILTIEETLSIIRMQHDCAYFSSLYNACRRVLREGKCADYDVVLLAALHLYPAPTRKPAHDH